MKKIKSEELVLEYFKGVDEENIDAILNTLPEDCFFSIETHGVKLFGHKEIIGMFKRLWRMDPLLKYRSQPTEAIGRIHILKKN